jgi:hypothetical protein
MRPLEDIINEFEDIKKNFKHFASNGDGNKDTLLEYQHRFVDLKSDLRYWHTKMLNASEMRSDKGATAIKMRIAVAMVRDEYEWSEGEKPMYDKAPAISNAEKFAGATKQYKEFLNQRTTHKENFTNVADLREDLNSYITLVRDRNNR